MSKNKEGFIKRMANKLDSYLKEKADKSPCGCTGDCESEEKKKSDKKNKDSCCS